MNVKKMLRTFVDNTLRRGEDICVLMITNRDSDNVGDQVIEACDIALVQTAIKNLGLDENRLKIESAALSIISEKYCATDNKNLLKRAYKLIENCTFVLFGGAPVFNYRYQYFYKKTAMIVNIAKELGKPVLFSAIGVNDVYDEENPKCAFLKNALHNGTVCQITTRDGIEQLQQYAEGESQFPVSLVSDPAVFTKDVFRPYISVPSKKKIGVFVFRGAGFTANGIRFTRHEQCCLWRDLCARLDEIGYDYELLTSGHFADEASLQYMIDEGYVKKEKCIRNINTPDELVRRISSYTGVVSCRLHPSIISFSCDVPSVGVIWNSKVTDFYRHIGYPERAISTDSICADNQVSAEPIITALEKAMEQGVKKDNTYVESVYKTLTAGIAGCVGIKEAPHFFEGEQLRENIMPYKGTTLEMERDKVERKFARCYGQYNAAVIPKNRPDEKLDVELIDQMMYHSGGKCSEVNKEVFGKKVRNEKCLESGSMELVCAQGIKNNGMTCFAKCGFLREGKRFKGWRVRFRMQSNWYWLLSEGGFCVKKKENDCLAHVYLPGEAIPVIPVKHINTMVAEAVWESAEYVIHYNSGHTQGRCKTTYTKAQGTTKKLQSGSVEFTAVKKVPNTGTERFLPNGFSYKEEEFTGWRMRIKENDAWYWFMEDGSFCPVKSYNAENSCNRRLFEDAASIPAIEGRDVESVVVEAVWKSV